MESEIVAILVESFERIAQTVDQRTNFSFKTFHVFMEDNTLLCLQVAKLEQFDCKRLFVETFANSGCSMLGRGKVKIVMVKKFIYLRFGSKLPTVFFIKWKLFACTVNLLCDRYQLLWVSEFSKSIF